MVFAQDNTLFGMSVCSDEVNFFENEVIDLMKKRWGESFSLGGLAGIPFAGKAGLSAYAHHVPDEGKVSLRSRFQLVAFAQSTSLNKTLLCSSLFSSPLTLVWVSTARYGSYSCRTESVRSAHVKFT